MAGKEQCRILAQKFNSTPYRSFMREYMHVHIQDGAVFKHEDIIWGQMLPLSQYDALCFYGDLSYKAAGDYKAMLLVGKTGRQYHIIYVYLRRGSRAKCAKWLYDLYEDKKLDRYNISYFIEGLFAMDEFVNDFDTEGDERGYHIPVVADKRGKQTSSTVLNQRPVSSNVTTSYSMSTTRTTPILSPSSISF